MGWVGSCVHVHVVHVVHTYLSIIQLVIHTSSHTDVHSTHHTEMEKRERKREREEEVRQSERNSEYVTEKPEIDCTLQKEIIQLHVQYNWGFTQYFS